MSEAAVEKYRVLILEDDPFIARLVLTNLQRANLECRVAPDGTTGLIEFRDFNPHLVITDLMMPGMDGRSVCATIRETSLVPIILMTAADTSEAELQAFKAGADDYIPKPFDPKLLCARVVAALRRVYRYDASIYEPPPAPPTNAAAPDVEAEASAAAVSGEFPSGWIACKSCGHRDSREAFRREDAKGRRVLRCPSCGEAEQFLFN